LDHLERVVTEFGGIALRYGVFYGAANDGTIEPVRKRQYARAKGELGWAPRHPSWRTGFLATYSASDLADQPYPARRTTHAPG
jgi:hypothetical protein